ncbi:Unknown protein [Striga hermonthica]|uniref:Ubiquitin-like protease family profile domain-containing protein n=1 Tax=Striga hermonthica TaxID=68872 RepID=A0A9N7R5M2_STRHE|nr:Unknown protein [Striga hermonthica]
MSSKLVQKKIQFGKKNQQTKGFVFKQRKSFVGEHLHFRCPITRSSAQKKRFSQKNAMERNGDAKGKRKVKYPDDIDSDFEVEQCVPLDEEESEDGSEANKSVLKRSKGNTHRHKSIFSEFHDEDARNKHKREQKDTTCVIGGLDIGIRGNQNVDDLVSVVDIPFEKIKRVKRYSILIPICLSLVKFVSRRADIKTNIGPYSGKAENGPLDVILVEDLPRQQCCDCGVFVASFAVYIVSNEPINADTFDVNIERLRPPLLSPPSRPLEDRRSDPPSSATVLAFEPPENTRFSPWLDELNKAFTSDHLICPYYHGFIFLGGNWSSGSSVVVEKNLLDGGGSTVENGSGRWRGRGRKAVCFSEVTARRRMMLAGVGGARRSSGC